MSNYYKRTTEKFRDLFFPAIVIIVSSVVAIFFLISFFTSKEDAASKINSSHLVHSIIDNWSDGSLIIASDYSVWNEAIKNIILEPNRIWIEDNYFSGIDNSDVLNGILVISKENEILAYSQSESVPFSIQSLLIEESKLLILEFLNSPKSYPKGMKGHLYKNGYLFSIGLHPFSPQNLERDPVGYEKNSAFLAIIKASTEEQLTIAGEKLNIRGLKFAELQSNSQDDQYRLHSTSGKPILGLQWIQSTPGSKLLKKLIPYLGIGSVFLILVFLLLLKRGTAIIEDLKQKEIKQRHLQNALAHMSGSSISKGDILHNQLFNLLKKASNSLSVENIVCWDFTDDSDMASCILCYNQRLNTSFERKNFPIKAFKIFSDTEENNEVVITNDVRTNHPFSKDAAKILKVLKINKVMTVPFYSQHELLGIIAVERTSGDDDFTEEEALFFRALSNIVSLLFSIDNQRKISDELIIAKMHAEHANIAKTAFLANMSHELRTPLNAIIGFAEVMSQADEFTESSSKDVEYAKHIHESGNLLLDIVNNLIDMAKIEAGTTELIETVTDVQHLWDNCSSELIEMAESKDITINCSILSKAKIKVDEKLFKKIFINILSNSIKFTDIGGEINISTEQPAVNGLNIIFNDNGIGMSELDLELALQPFTQVANHLTKAEGGSGLGLPLLKSFVEIHSGMLRIESALDIGTTVTVTIPASRMVSESEIIEPEFI